MKLDKQPVKLYGAIIKPVIASIAIALFMLTQAQCFADDGEFKSIHEQGDIDKSIWSVNYGGYVEGSLGIEQDFDLNEDKSNDVSSRKLEAGFSLLLVTGKNFDFYLETELSRRDFIVNETNKTENGFELTIDELYFDLTDEQEVVTVRVGRQAFKDDMEWIYDADLDGVRFMYRKDQYSLELSVTEEDTFDGDFLNAERDKDEDIKNLILVASYAPKKKYNLKGYLISRDENEFDGNRPGSLLITGIQSIGEVNKGFKHWANAAFVTGERQRSNDVRDIEAFGYDLGATFIGNSARKPSVTIGVAYGSGDAERNEGKDRNFRQSGLQDNYYRFNGVTKFKYLGEIFDPEITNISIVTLGLGMRPTKKSSIDIVYHIYKQDKAVDRLTGTNIDRDPKGVSKDLGEELDIIYGRKGKNIYLEAILAVFNPGDAFKSNADDAFSLAFELGYEF